jgi:protein phosphatase
MSLTRIPDRLGAEPQGRSAGRSHPGRVRDHNEDHWLARDDRGLWAVSDGMGGHEAGDVASAEIVRRLGLVDGHDGGAEALARDVVGRIEEADAALRAYAADRGAATVVCLVAVGVHGLAVWCGDSRLYRLREGEPMTRLTRDHTLVQDLVEQGHLDEAEAERHPQAHVLTRAVGAAPALELDFRTLSLRRGDRFPLCSDGLTRVVPEAEIEAVAADRATPPERVCATLEARTLERGAPDNVTVLVVDLV